jgi:hypothetical protein
VILRHPVERAYSNYLFSRAHGFESESFEDAVQLEAERLLAGAPAGASTHPQAYCWRGLYADRLAPFREQFAPDRPLTLCCEDLTANPSALFASLFRFIGVRDMPLPELGSCRENPAPGPRGRFGRAFLEELTSRYEASNREVSRWLGRDLSHWDRPPPQLIADTR